MDEKPKLTNNFLFICFLVVPAACCLFGVTRVSELSRTESNLNQPNILSGRMTRPNLTDEFSLT